VSLPLAALVRVVQAQTCHIAAIREMREVEAMLQIRQAVEVSQGSEFFEPQRLLAVEALAAAAKSGVAQVALAPSWRPELESFLAPDVLGQADVSLYGSPQKSSLRVDGIDP
jgi:hypothetical protein